VAIVSTDIVKRYSVTSGSAGNSTTSSAASTLGKYISTTTITDATLGNIFRQITAAEATSGITLYACVFVLNNHASLTYQSNSSGVSILSQTALGGTVTIGLDPAGVTAKGSSSAQAATIVNETTAPAGVTFSAGPLTMPDIPAGSCLAVWLKLVVPAGTAAINPDGVVLRFSGDTLP
jgi:hypothetical protein